jgi:mRNA interferase RelE/StbE
VSGVAAKQLKKLDQQAAKKIISYLRERVAKANDPTSMGKMLTGNKANMWRYRVGDYRIICDLKDTELTVLVLRLGHRKNIYNK